MFAKYDLHLHSHWSYDATSDISYYFEMAEKYDLKAIAITDHHTMDGLDELKSVVKKYPHIGYFAGAEMTVTSTVGAVDLVCLNLPLDTPKELEELFEEYRAWQRAWGHTFSQAMELAGFNYTDETRLEILKKYRSPEIIAKQGITHISNVIQREFLINNGIIKNEEEYFPFLYELYKLVDFPKYPDATKVTKLIKKYGGKIFIAHPVGYFQNNNLERMHLLKEELLLDGIECSHPKISVELTQFYRKFCVENKLLSSAGSDCHYSPYAKYLLESKTNIFAKHIGKNIWLDEILEQIPINYGV